MSYQGSFQENFIPCMYGDGESDSEVAASFKRMIILFNILIIIIQGTFQRRLLTTEGKMTL